MADPLLVNVPVRIKRLPHGHGLPLPAYATPGAAGMDLVAAEELILRAGTRALGWDGPGFDAAELDLCRTWLRSKGNSIEGGTSEIQLNVIAKRVLGLPD